MNLKTLISPIIPQPIKKLKFYLALFLKRKYLALKYPPLILRENSTDIEVFKSIFIFKELQLPVKIDAQLIIDAGAYTGLSTIYFRDKYPNAKIFAIEPNIFNFETLKKNTEHLSNIELLKGALWYKNCNLKIIDPGNGYWGFQTMESDEHDKDNIIAYTINDILSKSGSSTIDILKIDIEGAEKELFTYNWNSWLDKVNVIIIELHDRFKPWMQRGII